MNPDIKKALAQYKRPLKVTHNFYSILIKDADSFSVLHIPLSETGKIIGNAIAEFLNKAMEEAK